jgi:hypothetical protein
MIEIDPRHIGRGLQGRVRLSKGKYQALGSSMWIYFSEEVESKSMASLKFFDLLRMAFT